MEFYEDVEVGTTVEHGATTMSRADIVSFATVFDPQPIHVDEAAAAESMFDGLIASGWHTASVCMRLLVEGVLDSQAALGGSGLETLRWHEPVRPGDRISIEVELLEKSPDPGDDSRGRLRTAVRGYNQEGVKVISWVSRGLIARRSPA